MYYYLYDTFLNDKKYEKVLDKIKTRLLDLDIKGKHERLSLLKSLDALIADEAKRGVQTIIIVGNDKSFLKAVDVVARHNLTLGIIPIGEDNLIAKILGVPLADEACEVLAARKIIKFDLGQVNNLYFFSNLRVRKNIDRISISHQGYRVIPKPRCSEVAIYNFLITEETKLKNGAEKINPGDDLLDLVIKSEDQSNGVRGIFKKQKQEKIDSIIQGVNFEVKSFEYLPLMVDDYRVVKTPVAVKLADKKLQVIVGKTKNLINNKQ